MSERANKPRPGGRDTEAGVRGARRQPEQRQVRNTGPVADRIIDHARARRREAQAAVRGGAQAAVRGGAQAAVRGGAQAAVRGGAQAAVRGGAQAAVRGGDAPVQGTAALKLDTAVAEPLRVEPETAPRLRVAPPAPISAPRAPFIAGVIALVVVGVIGILVINTETNTNTFEISQLQEQQTDLNNQQQRLENQLAVYESAGNLDAAAKRLGLVKAEAPAWLRLPDGRVLGVPKPGRGKPAVTAQDPEEKAAASKPEQQTEQAIVPEGQLSGGQVTQNAGE